MKQFRNLALVFKIACSAVLAALVWLIPVGSYADNIPMIDAHSQLPSPETAADVIRLMDKAGIAHVILSFRRKGTSADVIGLAKANPGRITPAIKIKGANWPTGSEKFYKSVKKQLNTGAYGAIGEALFYHAQKGNKAPERSVLPGEKQFQYSLELARDNSWPMIIHIEIRAVGDREKFMGLLEKLMAENRDMKFPLIHMAQLDPSEAERLIDAHSNVFFMTSHSNPVTTTTSKQPWTNMFKNGCLKPAWRKLITKHPDRFVLNFDNVWPEDWGDSYLDQVKLWRNALNGLPHDVAHLVAHENAEQLWRLKPTTSDSVSPHMSAKKICVPTQIRVADPKYRSRNKCITIIKAKGKTATEKRIKRCMSKQR